MAEGYVTTHVLDAAPGLPGGGACGSTSAGSRARTRRLVRSVVTNADGRTDAPVIPKGELAVGVYELVFHAGAYLDAAGAPGEARASST